MGKLKRRSNQSDTPETKSSDNGKVKNSKNNNTSKVKNKTGKKVKRAEKITGSATSALTGLNASQDDNKNGKADEIAQKMAVYLSTKSVKGVAIFFIKIIIESIQSVAAVFFAISMVTVGGVILLILPTLLIFMTILSMAGYEMQQTAEDSNLHPSNLIQFVGNNYYEDNPGNIVAEYALQNLGAIYSQIDRWGTNSFDCSSLAYRGWQEAGTTMGDTTAAGEAEWCDSMQNTYSESVYVVDNIGEMIAGDLIFYAGGLNGRYKNISHVAIYIGNGKIVEAVNPVQGVIMGDIYTTNGSQFLVMIGRPSGYTPQSE